ncbi:MAG: hypothetical protein OWQ59_09010 [Alicyclobacillaceae bacterium]|jgi:hypothetical protein|uniref:hypothetical protein n=1 Tax=Alicyclobacillus sp. SP_1 TaxID=2942475 RepID=UPI0021570171|nr:hypothetical protein [Alicyclobacillus sp. SP_1]MCY0888578.1 hypothetical protein [Alicyclobacillaceae bacterium]MCY0894961.1 hypothetical protein [Alicyclobacillaceae bacterium]
MTEERVLKQAEQSVGPFEWKLEGLEDGYRVTFRGNSEKLKVQRRVAGSFIAFLQQLDRAGFWVPFPFRWMLRFWDRYNGRSSFKKSA